MTLTMRAADFVRGVNSVLAAASADRTTPALNVVRVEWDADGVTFAATDRYVLAEQYVPQLDAERIASDPRPRAEVLASMPTKSDFCSSCPAFGKHCAGAAGPVVPAAPRGGLELVRP